jgi:hypothetical protein
MRVLVFLTSIDSPGQGSGAAGGGGGAGVGHVVASHSHMYTLLLRVELHSMSIQPVTSMEVPNEM